jgi:hypothetical protein
LALLAASIACAAAAPGASAATARWWGCGTGPAATAAQAAGVPAALDADPGLRRVFGDDPPSSILEPYRAFCADFDRDGDVDRALLYACCTVSSPGPYAILRNDGAGRFSVSYARLGDIVFSLRPRGGRLVVRSPKYGPADPNCCPSRLSVRVLRWTGTRWAGRVSVRRAR